MDIHFFDQEDKEMVADSKVTEFRVSVYGIIRDGNRVMMQINPKNNFVGFAGGGVEKHETLEQALKREFKEETVLDDQPLELANVKQSFFWHTDPITYCNSVLVFYHVEKIGGSEIEGMNEEGDSVGVKWYEIDELLHTDKIKIESFTREVLEKIWI